jgi:two-component system CheB/CheR fusion protein
LNEELTAVNSQLQLKMDELESATSDLTSLLSNTEVAVIFLDLTLRIRRFTPPITDLLDLIPSDAGRPLAALAPKFHDPDFLDDANLVATTHQRAEKEIKSDSGRIYLRRTLPYRTNDNRVDGIVITFVDISRLKEAEESLRANEQRHRLILESVRDYAIFLIDANGIIGTWPAGAEHVFGYPPGEALGQAVGFLYNEADRAEGIPEHEIARARVAGSVVEAHWQVRKDGTQFWVEGTVSALVGPEGRIAGFVKVLRDSTNQKLSAEALKQAKSEAEAANAAKDHFLATVSHELRTPLTPMMLWAQILDREETPDRALLHEGLEMIRKCAEEQHELIEDLVDTSRIVTGKLRLELRPTELVSLVQSAIELARPAAALKNLTLQTSLDDKAGTVMVDPGRMQQVIGNLLNNAVKFTPDGGQISLQLRREGATIVIEVSDNGIGITPEFLPKVFSRFGQMEDSTTRVASGLGLGLSIARQLVELHHGTVTAQSDGADRGTTFVVKLPLPALSAAEADADGDAFLPSPSSKNLQGLHVLLVEDTENSRHALTLVLRNAGAEIAPVATGAAAVEEFKRHRPDVILSDLGMPQMDGHELMRKLREIEASDKTPRVPAVALTAYADEKNRRLALENGFNECVTKPIDYDRLVGMLEAIKSKTKG